MDITDLATAFGLILVIEGLLYTLFPDFMRRAMAELLSMEQTQIRTVALISAALGVGIVWLARG